MATSGKIVVTIFQGDRELWTDGRVRLRVLDPFSNTEKKLAEVDTNAGISSVILDGVPTDRGQNYSLIATKKGFRDAAVYPVKPLPGAVIGTSLMMVRKNPQPDFSSVSFERVAEFSPNFVQALTDGQVTEAAFLALPPERIAGALNIEAKLRNTLLDGTPGIELIRQIESAEGIQQDRIRAKVDQTMPKRVRAEIEQSGSFSEVPAFANEVSHKGFPISFKQKVPFGSLQLSFARNPDNDGLLRADIDIDLFTDIGHFGEVLRNIITQKETDPYTVYVQLFDQGIFPIYVLQA